MNRKALAEVLSDGTLLNISWKEVYDFKSDFQKRVRPQKFMRIGQYAVTIGHFDLSISSPDEYRTNMRHMVAAGSPYFNSSKLDRLDQIRDVEQALKIFPGHPFEGLVRLAIKLERAYFAKRR